MADINFDQFSKLAKSMFQPGFNWEGVSTVGFWGNVVRTICELLGSDSTKEYQQADVHVVRESLTIIDGLAGGTPASKDGVRFVQTTHPIGGAMKLTERKDENQQAFCEFSVGNGEDEEVLETLRGDLETVQADLRNKLMSLGRGIAPHLGLAPTELAKSVHIGDKYCIAQAPAAIDELKRAALKGDKQAITTLLSLQAIGSELAQTFFNDLVNAPNGHVNTISILIGMTGQHEKAVGAMLEKVSADYFCDKAAAGFKSHANYLEKRINSESLSLKDFEGKALEGHSPSMYYLAYLARTGNDKALEFCRGAYRYGNAQSLCVTVINLQAETHEYAKEIIDDLAADENVNAKKYLALQKEISASFQPAKKGDGPAATFLLEQEAKGSQLAKGFFDNLIKSPNDYQDMINVLMNDKDDENVKSLFERLLTKGYKGAELYFGEKKEIDEIMRSFTVAKKIPSNMGAEKFT